MTNSMYLPVIVLLLAAVAFALATLLLAWLWARFFSPHKPGPSKNAIYECGLESEGDAWIQFKPGYYKRPKCPREAPAGRCGGPPSGVDPP